MHDPHIRFTRLVLALVVGLLIATYFFATHVNNDLIRSRISCAENGGVPIDGQCIYPKTVK